MPAKTSQLNIRMPRSEAQAVTDASAAAGVSISAYVRAALLERGRFDQLSDRLSADFQAQAADADAKLKLISDQIHALTIIVTGSKQ